MAIKVRKQLPNGQVKEEVKNVGLSLDEQYDIVEVKKEVELLRTDLNNIYGLPNHRARNDYMHGLTHLVCKVYTIIAEPRD